MIKYLNVVLLLLFVGSCKSSGEFTGFSYDPPDVTNTTDKEIQLQPKRIIGVDSPKVWVSNEFDGARLNDFYLGEDSLFNVHISPENAPINSSPWYAFKLWSDTTRSVKIRINYEEARHRYEPKLFIDSEDGWYQKMKLPVNYDSTSGTAVIELMLSKEPVLVSAQPLHTTSNLKKELKDKGILDNGFVHYSHAGKSKHGRPIIQLDITETGDDEIAPVLVIISRQHPPEITGYKASLIFLEEFVSDHELAKQFRNTFIIKAFPMLNPDGVDMGHWRHNAGGIDLNRDWEHFNQPETRTVRNALATFVQNDKKKMFYAIDFHSTNENIFYPINRKIKTEPDNITQKWVHKIIDQHPSINFNIEEFDTSSPIAKNWFYRTFGIDALTYEVDDNIDPEDLDAVSRSAAQLLMQLLLDEWEKSTLEN